MRHLQTFLLLLLLGSAALAQGETLTRMVVKNTTPGIEEGSFVLLPRTIYRQGTAFARVEEAPSPSDGVHLLIIRANDEMWQIDLNKASGVHGGGLPTEVRVPIWSELAVLEFGQEVEFMKANEVTPETVEGPDGKPVMRYGVRTDSLGIALYVTPETEVPVAVRYIDLESGDIRMAVDYVEYELGLPAQPELFVPPAGIQWRESE